MEKSTQEKLLHQLHHSFSLIRRGRHDVARRGCGSKRGQGRLLNILVADGSQNEMVLAQKFQIRPFALSDLLGKMEAKGFISIKDGIVSISEAGTAKAKEIDALRQDIAATLLGGLTAQEQAQLSELLGKLVGSLETKLASDAPEGEFHLRKGYGFRKHDKERCRSFTKCNH